MRALPGLLQANFATKLHVQLHCCLRTKNTLSLTRFYSTAAMPYPKVGKQTTLDRTVKRSKPPGSSKRKASPEPDKDSKKPKVEEARSWSPSSSAHGDEPVEERVGIVDRRFYPRQMGAARCQEYMNGTRLKPIEVLEKAIKETKEGRAKIKVKEAVVHWFKCDTRIHDNHGLHLASEKAKSKGVPLIGVYIVSPEDFEAHATAPIRVDFILRNLEVLKADLAKLDIPLYIETVPERKNVVSKLLDLCEEWGAAHLFANMEYEADELRREAKLMRQGLERQVDVTAVHDTCVVPPGLVTSGKGTQYAVYSPYYKTWMRYIHEHEDLLNIYPTPGKNPSSARKKLPDLFDAEIPNCDEEKSLESKRLSEEEQERFRNYWPAGEHEAQDRLKKFLATRVGKYKDLRDMPAMLSTSLLSCHLAAGTLSARTAVRAARDFNTSDNLDAGKKGIIVWVSEIAWRDFYRHIMVNWPYILFNVPFKPEYNDIKWDYDMKKFDKWAQGMTGFPIVDAAIRQMNHTGYMHNRCRMIVASFLCKDLLLDWRMGERHFMSHLIDGDFASNNGGWGFSSSAGVDPNPYFRIFNPTLQGQKFDPHGEYVKKWVPELREIKGTEVHDPYNRGTASAIAQRGGYPKPMVDHKEMREKALKMYKEGLGRNTT